MCLKCLQVDPLLCVHTNYLFIYLCKSWIIGIVLLFSVLLVWSFRLSPLTIVAIYVNLVLNGAFEDSIEVKHVK